MIFDDLVPAPGAAVDPQAIRRFLSDARADADALAATPQDPRWHAEGDVWTHTRMVLDELVALPAWRALEPAARAITFVAALAHDLGKPATTRTEPDGSISSRGHSARGEHLVRRWLYENAVPFGVREHVCALVRHHQVPFFGITREPADAEETALRLSRRLRHDWLALVTEADGRGRRTADPAEHARMLEHTALWVEHCRELGCLDRPRVIVKPHEQYIEHTCEVTVMCGLPATGKDVWLHAHRPDLPVVSLDAIREIEREGVIYAAREAARGYLRARRDFAWNATNVGARVRSSVIELARAYRARVHVVYLEAPAAELEARNRARVNPVPRAAVERMIDRWSVPTLDEAHRVTYIVDDPGPVSWPMIEA